jgi:competence ComEA-like helix-hairpin-helix protein
LGLNEKNAATILKYVSKGGKFRSSEDLRKIYGIPELVIERIMPYAVFNTDQVSTNKKEFSALKSVPIKKIDINEADSTALVDLPGIGEKLSTRIIKYRDRLGGFHSAEQLSEVFGISDSAIILVRERVYVADVYSVKKIFINTVDYRELTKHPYMSFVMAKLILAYRKTHGKINGTNDMKMIEGIDADKMSKLIPYLSF